METKLIPASEIRFVDDLDDSYDSGRFSGRASVYNNVDSYGDVVMPGAFTETIKKNKGRIVILNQHDPARPIGTGELRDTAHALYVDAKLNMELQEARDVHSNLLHGVISGLSIGFVTQKSRTRRDGVREILGVDLWEVSTVTFPANSAARVTDAKSVDADDLAALRALSTRLSDTVTSARLALAGQRLDRLTAEFRNRFH